MFYFIVCKDQSNIIMIITETIIMLFDCLIYLKNQSLVCKVTVTTAAEHKNMIQ